MLRVEQLHMASDCIQHEDFVQVGIDNGSITRNFVGKIVGETV